MKTTLHAYNFDTNNESEAAEYLALKTKLKGQGLKVFKSHGGGSHYLKNLDGLTLTLETKQLFNNQWNTGPIEGISENGYRVFDWAEDALFGHYGNELLRVRKGHYLDQTEDMKAARDNTVACGYCGKQADIKQGYTFCPCCIGSEYLTKKELHLTRMQAISNIKPRKELSEAESLHLHPLFIQAQIHGNTERDKLRIEKRRNEILIERDNAIKNANTEYDGLTWLIDHGINTANCIYYKHTGRFCFGWRHTLDNELNAELIKQLDGFIWPYDIKTA